MVKFTCKLEKFASQGEKTGWTYINVPASLAEQLKPGNRKSFRVKGKLDNYEISKVALLPMGDGDFILAVNATMRKAIRKQKGATVAVRLTVDEEPILPSKDFMTCLHDEPAALNFFEKLPRGHQNYFSKWIDAAKTEPTRAKRIAQAVNALAKKLGFPQMLRAAKAEKDQF